MPGVSWEQRRAMARALNRAADHFDQRVREMDDRMSHWRKDRLRDPTPIEASTLREVVRDLRTWASKCWPPP
ncbi:MAG: hypothetical protein M3082_12025 [Candidatus Dormibacteraeota bacterium]|nr:hypothetical protein [Candidatus Dormibacteraeota bacterium]